jgi:hypothetical protein
MAKKKPEPTKSSVQLTVADWKRLTTMVDASWATFMGSGSVVMSFDLLDGRRAAINVKRLEGTGSPPMRITIHEKE